MTAISSTRCVKHSAPVRLSVKCAMRSATYTAFTSHRTRFNAPRRIKETGFIAEPTARFRPLGAYYSLPSLIMRRGDNGGG